MSDGNPGVCKHGNNESTCQRCVWLSPLMLWMYALMLCAAVVGVRQMPAHVAQDAADKRQEAYVRECLKRYKPFVETPVSLEGQPR